MKIGITQGDPNGVGYEVILKALADDRILELFTPVVYGSTRLADFYGSQLGIEHIDFTTIKDASQADGADYYMVQCVPESFHATPGTPSAEAGATARVALERAVEDLREGYIDALVTAPIDKNTIHSGDFDFTGHTDFLEARLGGKALMILFNDKMRVALATVHVPVSRISESLSRELIVERIRQLNDSLSRDFGIVRPRIAVLALNPHAGDGGLLGSEENEIIRPAIEECREAKLTVFGPYPADGFFGSGDYEKFDGILAMYHDQGLAPLKALGMDSGVNFTAGLPAVRTSPDHGTAYDIAGRGEASDESMRNAIYSAIDICRNREAYDNARRDPLPMSLPEKRQRQPRNDRNEREG